MPESKIQTSFAAGELSPTLYARVDIDKFTIGLALSRNFFIDWRGGASNRAGTKYINICKTAGARLIPFTFNTEITYMMEFGGGYIRFYTSGQPVLEQSIPVLTFTNADPGVWYIPNHNYSVGDEVIISAPNIEDFDERQLLVGEVVDANDVTFTDIFGNDIDTTSETFAGPVTSSRIYTLSTPYQAADVFDLNYVQSADVITIVHPNYVPQDLDRENASQFTLTEDVPGPIIQPPTNLTGHATSGTSYNYGYVVTALNEDGTEESIMSTPVVVQSALLDPTGTPPIQITLNWEAPADLVVSAYNIYKWGSIGRSDGTPPTVFGYIGQTNALSFTDNNIAADFSKVPDAFVDPFSTGQIVNISVNSGGAYTSGGGESYVALTITGDGTGAAGFGVVDYQSGAIVGAFITNPGKGYTEATATAGAGGATFTVQIGPETGTYPSVASYVQQRRAFAAPNGDPQAITMSQTGNYENFNVSPVVADSDAITLRLASTEVDFIQSMTPMSTGLVILTTGGAWLLSGGTPGAPITPSETTATRQASHGANRLPGIVWNYDLLYMQQKGNTVRDLAFNFYLQSYVGNDRSYLSQHLFTNYNFVQWCAAEEPLKLVWIVRDDGVMLTMTYLPEQEVYGWAHHDTQGLFRSVATVSEGTVDAVYAIVSRYIQPGADCGSGWYDFIERFDDRKFDCTEDVWFLDCALSNEKEFPAFTIYDSGPIGTIGGNVEICAAPSTDLYGNAGLNSPTGPAALSYVASSAAPVHYVRGNFDFDGNRLYHEQGQKSGDPGTNGHSMFVFDLQTRQQLFGPLAPGEIAEASPTVTCMGQDRNVYFGTSDNSNIVGQFNAESLTSSSYNNTGGPTLAAVGYISTLEDSLGNIFTVATGLNSGADSAPCFVVQYTGAKPGPVIMNDPAIGGQPYNQYFDEAPGSIAPGNGIPVKGPIGCCFLFYIGPPGGVGNIQMGMYLLQVIGENPAGQVYTQKLATIMPATIDAAWTTIGIETAIYDETDGNVICLLVGNNNANYYMTKFAANGAILWKTKVLSAVPFWQTRVRHGILNFIVGSPDAILQIDTLTGAVVSVSESIFGAGLQAFDDNTGQLVINVNDIGTTMWDTLGPQSPEAWAQPGQVVQIGCGKIEVETNDTPWESHGTVLTPITNAIPNDPSGTVGTPVTSGNYSVATPTNVMKGLWHLEGKIVDCVADGQVYQGLTVVNGQISLPNGHTATNIVVGLAYQAQMQTLYLDAQGPNMQGKRKTIPAATIRVTDTRGPKIGRSFDENDLVEMQGLMAVPGVTPMPLMTGDFRETLFSDWETNGQICIQQDYPLPITVLGIMPEFVRGDTAN